MDRDNRWERIENAYRAMVHGDTEAKFTDPVAAVRASYEKGVTDEFILPATITTEAAPGSPGRAARPDPQRRRRDFLQFPRRPRSADDARR